MLTVIAARPRMRVSDYVFSFAQSICCCEAIYACVGVYFGLVKAHGHCDCCEAMHAVCMLVFMLVQGAWSL
jgi:hypothetical protein